jgi:nitrite reductase (NADH) small subunit
MIKREMWIRITLVQNIPLREGRSVKIAGREIAIFNLGDRILAVENRCPHKGGPLAEGIVSGATVVCPLHALKIGLEDGKTLNEPPSRHSHCVATFRTRVRDGVISIELPVNSRVTEEMPAGCTDRGVPLAWTESATHANG